jgi:hypothetical protein
MACFRTELVESLTSGSGTEETIESVYCMRTTARATHLDISTLDGTLFIYTAEIKGNGIEY